jgi:hypothetical protein
MTEQENLENEESLGLEIGRVYFMREVDLLSGIEFPYYKIGKVLNDKDVQKRLKEHQTGNPRGIQVVDEIQSRMVTRLETALHNLNAANRVHSGEWFYFPDSQDLEAVISRAKELNNDIELNAGAVSEASVFAKNESNGEVRKADSELMDIAVELAGYIRSLKIVDGLAKNVKNAIAELPQDEAWSRVASYTSPAPTAKFSTTDFKKAHPDTYAEFTIKPKLQTRFSLDNDLQFAELKVEYGNSHDNDWLSGISLEELHAEYLRLWSLKAELQWQSQDLESLIRQAVGDFDGIEGIVSWKRKNSLAFDASVLKAERPELHSAFVKESQSKPSLKVYEWKSYR